jgi:RHS repeat-associated protein
MHGAILDQVLADDSNGNILWALTDNLGTVRDVVNSSGVVQNHVKYDSFGNITNQLNAITTTRFGFTGREWDAWVSLYFYRGRYYDPIVGRFINEDRISFAGGDTNLYRYVRNKPINATDPFGLYPNVPTEGFPGEVISPPPYIAPLTPIHQEIINLTRKTRVIPGTNEWQNLDAVAFRVGFLDINKFKNQWVCGYKDVITQAARRFDIPVRLLAAIAWREVGGAPPIFDPFAYNLRRLTGITGNAFQTSYGDLSIQIQVAANALGYSDPAYLTYSQWVQLLRSLEAPRQNVFIAAKVLADIKTKYLPGRSASSITSDYELSALAGAYNRGAVYRALQEFWDRQYAQYGRSAFMGLKQCGCF